MDELLALVGLTFEELNGVPLEVRPNSLVFSRYVDPIGEIEGMPYFEIIGFIAEDPVEEGMTIVVGLEGQPLRAEELLIKSRRFRIIGPVVVEWRGEQLSPLVDIEI
jgi:hypothetical protein